jgi:DNA-binding transcriptional regulator YiaG
MVKKNRQARGERHSQAKLSADDVIAIRQEKATGAAQRDIAKRYHVSMGTVSMIVNNKIWRSTISTLRRN